MYIQKHNNKFAPSSYTIDQNVKGKMHTFYVKDLGLDWNKTKYKYRSVFKCTAGFLTIGSGEGIFVTYLDTTGTNSLMLKSNFLVANITYLFLT